MPSERFSHFELTDESEGERLDRIPVVKGEIRLADRAYISAERIAAVIDTGGDIVVRAGWKNARWLGADGKPFDLIAALKKASELGKIDMPVWLGRKGAPALALRLVAVRKPPHAIAQARRQARQAAQRKGSQISDETLVAAEWVILVTSLAAEAYSADDVLALYRLRWRIELAFKRLKSLIGLKEPPGFDERSAKPWILAHLLLALLIEPLADGLDDLPRAGRLTPPARWRLCAQLVETLLQAILPQAPSAASAGPVRSTICRAHEARRGYALYCGRLSRAQALGVGRERPKDP